MHEQPRQVVADVMQHQCRLGERAVPLQTAKTTTMLAAEWKKKIRVAPPNHQQGAEGTRKTERAQTAHHACMPKRHKTWPALHPFVRSCDLL